LLALISFLYSYPNIVGSKNQSTNEGQRFTLTGTIDRACNDLQRMKQMAINHMIIGYNFIAIGSDLDKMMEITKQISKCVRTANTTAVAFYYNGSDTI
jgi:hypothetical protein